jgi:hypothetical protein
MKRRVTRIVVAVGIGVLGMAAVGVWLWPRAVEHSIDYKMPGNPGPKIAAAEAAAIERRERVVAQTVWRKELEAQEHGRVFEDFWDALNAGTNAARKWEVVENFRFGEVALGQGRVKESLAHGIERWVPAKGEKLESPHVDFYEGFEGWMERVREWKAAGWGIMQCEFRQNAFDPQTNDVAAKSRFYFSAHLTNAAPARAVVEGDLLVEWNLRVDKGPPAVRRVDASRLDVAVRNGPPAFVEVLNETFDPPDLSASIEPLLVYDLDRDGLPEIALPTINRVYRWRNHRFEHGTFSAKPVREITAGLLADFDSDGITDFVYANFQGIHLQKGTGDGKFNSGGRRLIDLPDGLAGPRAMSCGDMDGDGDLDLFVGQYKGPFIDGNMPTPYYDANDGYPSFVLMNHAGNLLDVTMGFKRLRRVYAASFVDLNGDGKLDLIVTSDFAGVDVYRGDGGGKFTDVTAQWIDQPRLFGMGHAIGDFNRDGLLDLIVTGMNSATADRLDWLGLNRPQSKLDPGMRKTMAYGTGVYIGMEDGVFKLQRNFVNVTRSGWAWGAAACDLNNDGFQDIYVANGMESSKTVRDYDLEFWLHDIFVGNSKGSAAQKLYFTSKGQATRGQGWSYGGFEKNRCFLNVGGAKFLETAHLFGVALEEDCRNLVVTDVNGDGKEDIVVTSIKVRPTASMPTRIRRSCSARTPIG